MCFLDFFLTQNIAQIFKKKNIQKNPESPDMLSRVLKTFCEKIDALRRKFLNSPNMPSKVLNTFYEKIMSLRKKS